MGLFNKSTTWLKDKSRKPSKFNCYTPYGLKKALDVEEDSAVTPKEKKALYKEVLKELNYLKANPVNSSLYFMYVTNSDDEEHAQINYEESIKEREELMEILNAFLDDYKSNIV